MSDDGCQEKYGVWNKMTRMLGSAVLYRAKRKGLS